MPVSMRKIEFLNHKLEYAFFYNFISFTLAITESKQLIAFFVNK